MSSTRPGTLLLALLCLLATLARAAEPANLRFTVKGIGKTQAQNLRLHLGTLDASLGQHPDRLEAIVRRALDDALQPYGYYEAEVALAMGKSGWIMQVTPGPRIEYGEGSRIEVDAEARALPAVAEELARAPFAPGTPLSHADYDAWRDTLLGRVRQHGYLEARYATRELRIDRAARMARVDLVLQAGPRYRFGRLELNGSRLDPALLRTMVTWQEGDWFEGPKMRLFEQRLRDTGYFRDVGVTLRREKPDQAHVVVLAEDQLTSRYDVGAGFSTDSDLRLRFNRYSPQLDERGDSLTIESQFSEPRQLLSATLRRPHKDPLDDVYELYAALQGENVEDTDSLQARLGARHLFKIGGDWSWSQGISAEYERYTLGSESEKTAQYLMPATSLARTRLDRGIDPLHGYSLWTALDGSHESVGAPTAFLRARGRLRWLFPLPDHNTTVLTRADLGGIWTDAFNEIPASLRFDAGGDQSIRGYDIDSLGPRDANGKLLGGRYLAVGSVEISRRVLPKWRVAVFVDGGGAFTERNDDLYQSVGVGVRWLSPIGQIRADIGVPIHDEEADGFKLHISMGPPL